MHSPSASQKWNAAIVNGIKCTCAFPCNDKAKKSALKGSISVEISAKLRSGIKFDDLKNIFNFFQASCQDFSG